MHYSPGMTTAVEGSRLLGKVAPAWVSELCIQPMMAPDNNVIFDAS